MPNKNETYLTLFKLNDTKKNKWFDHLTQTLPSLNYNYKRTPYSVKAWKSHEKKPVNENVCYAYGYEISSMDEGDFITVSQKTFLFDSDKEYPSQKPFTKLLNSNEYPPQITKRERIAAILEFVKKMAEKSTFLNPEPVAPVEIRRKLHSRSQYILAKGSPASCGTKLSSSLMSRGFYDPPMPLKINIIIPGEDETGGLMTNHINRAADRLNTTVECNMWDYDNILEKIEMFKNRGNRPEKGRVSLIGVRGQKGEPLDEKAQKLTAKMDGNGIPYRLFSLDNTELKWSAFDMFGILVSLAGGIPYKLKLPLPEKLKNPVFLGIDLGHPKSQCKSYVVITAVDSHGLLQAYWKGVQPRDETLRPETMKNGLKWIRNFLNRRFDNGCEIIVMRDGRMFKNESFKPFEQAFNQPFTFMEIRKSPAPCICQNLNTALAGTACKVNGITGTFLTAYYTNNKENLTHPVRIRIPRDDLSLGENAAVEIVAGLCYAPTLGLLPSRIPAPVYWADGIAAIGPLNHQFSGLHFVEHYCE